MIDYESTSLRYLSRSPFCRYDNYSQLKVSDRLDSAFWHKMKDTNIHCLCPVNHWILGLKRLRLPSTIKMFHTSDNNDHHVHLSHNQNILTSLISKNPEISMTVSSLRIIIVRHIMIWHSFINRQPHPLYRPSSFQLISSIDSICCYRSGHALYSLPLCCLIAIILTRS